MGDRVWLWIGKRSLAFARGLGTLGLFHLTSDDSPICSGDSLSDSRDSRPLWHSRDEERQSILAFAVARRDDILTLRGRNVGTLKTCPAPLNLEEISRNNYLEERITEAPSGAMEV